MSLPHHFEAHVDTEGHAAAEETAAQLFRVEFSVMIATKQVEDVPAEAHPGSGPPCYLSVVKGRGVLVTPWGKMQFCN